MFNYKLNDEKQTEPKKKLWFFLTLLTNLFLSIPLFPGYREQGYQYISPIPEAKHVTPQSTIIIRFETALPNDLINLSTFIRVTGEKSGSHSGQTMITGDEKTIIFKPVSDFLTGETVFISLDPKFGNSTKKKIQPLKYWFEVSKTDIQQHHRTFNDSAPCFDKTGSPQYASTGQATIMENGVSVPGDFPHVRVTVNDNPDSGFIFLNNWGPPNYNLILENSGAPFWYHRTRDWDNRRDFKVQPNGWLTMLIRGGYGKPEKDHVSNWGFIALDNNYNHIKTFRASNGYFTDEHELQVLSNGGYLLIGRREHRVDMSRYIIGGRTNAIVLESCIQEYTPNDELIFLWRAWDHFDIRDLQFTILFGNTIYFPHMNSIDIDEDNHILLSSRNLNEVTKIHRQTGEIIWRLSGPKNQFTFLNDDLNGFTTQHDIRALGNNHYTIFDNGDLHHPPLTRAVEYKLNPDQMTATLVWEYQNNKPLTYSYYMGNVQRLSNGNTLINWAIGSLPKATEVQPNGKKVYEMGFIDGYHTYRTFRFPWDGISLVPYLIIEPEIDHVALIFNKFGDPNVDYYNIYGGQLPNPTTLLDTSKLTLKHLSNLTNRQQYYFRITSVDKNGQESDYSNEENIYVNLSKPGENLIQNGDFSDELNHWTFETNGSAIADISFLNQICHFQIDQGGMNNDDIRLKQSNIALIQDKEYIIQFNAWADEDRIIEVKVAKDNDSWTDYSGIGLSYITRLKKHFLYTFKMENPSDNNCRIEINCGSSNIDIYIDTISLTFSDESNISEFLSDNPSHYDLIKNFPNPFNSATTISFYIPERSVVRIEIYNILGEFKKEICTQFYEKGFHQIQMEGTGLNSGIYFCKMFTGHSTLSLRPRESHKFIVIK